MTTATQLPVRTLPSGYRLRLRFERHLLWQGGFVALAPFLLATSSATARWEKAKDLDDFVVLGFAALLFLALLGPTLTLWLALAWRAFVVAPKEAAALVRGSAIAATVSEERGVRAARFVVDGVARVVPVKGVKGVDVGAVVNVVCSPDTAFALADMPGRPRVEGGAVVVEGGVVGAVVGALGFAAATAGIVAVTAWALTGVVPVVLFIVRF